MDRVKLHYYACLTWITCELPVYNLMNQFTLVMRTFAILMWMIFPATNLQIFTNFGHGLSSGPKIDYLYTCPLL